MSNQRKEGVIEAVTKDGKGFLIEGIWYKCFTPTMLKAGKGEFVSFSYKEVNSNGRVFYNVSGIVTGSGNCMTSNTTSNGLSSAPAPSYQPAQRDPLMLPVMLARERAIIRQSSLAQAVNYVKDCMSGITTDEVIRIAREFEAYASGDADIEAAKNSLSNESIAGSDD